MRTIDEAETIKSECDPSELYELAVYKRLGFTSDIAKRIGEITANIPIDRLTEICEAEREGRLIICDKIKTAEEIKFEKYCSHAKRYEDGKCEGLACSAENDEPCEMCKNCEKHYLFDDEALEVGAE